MWMRRIGSLSLAFSILLVTMVASGGHEHGPEIELGEYGCAVDHDSSAAVAAAAAEARIDASGELHHHRCLGCHHTGKRSLFLTLGQAAISRLPQSRWVAIRSTPRVFFVRTGLAFRGPPPVSSPA